MKKIMMAGAKYIALFVTVVMIVLSIAPASDVHAKGKAAENQKLIKKLKKNAWTSHANPASKTLTLGQVLYYLYGALMDTGIYDDKDYWSGIVWAGNPSMTQKMSKYASFDKIEGGTKKQRKIAKWMLENVPQIGNCYYVQESFDLSRYMTRRETEGIICDIMDSCFPFMLERIKLNGTYYDENNKYHRRLSEYADRVQDVGIIVGNELYMGENITYSDLKKAIKNFKLVVANRIEPVVNVTGEASQTQVANDLCDMLNKLKNSDGELYWGASIGSDIVEPSGEKWKEVSASGNGFTYDLHAQVFKERVMIGWGYDFVETCTFDIDMKKYDVVATIKRIMKTRY